MAKALRAGAVYFAITFALGFALGTFRVLVLGRFFSETIAVLMETPLILSLSWVVCRILIRKINVQAMIPARVTMGAMAFALLMTAEQLLGLFVFNRDFDALIFHYQTSAGLIGLVSQIAFAFFPLIQLLVANRR